MLSFKLNKSDYKLIGVFTLVITIWLLLKFWTENNPLDQILFDVPIIVLKTLVAFFIIRWLIQKYIVEKRQYFLFFVLAILALVATGFVDLLRDYFGRGYSWSDLPSVGYILIHSFYYSAADLSAPFIVVVAKKYFENQQQLSKARERQRESELKLLRSQLSPHFLFNNLNTVDSLIDTSPDKAKAYVSKLSSLYRYLISTKDTELVKLESELQMARDYTFLIETRFGTNYVFELPLNYAEDLGFYLPMGALQTVLENAVKHNKTSHEKSIVTSLKIEEEHLIVKNNKGVSNKSLVSLGTGLDNLKERYHLLLGKRLVVENTNSHFIVKLPLVQLVNT